MTRKQYSLLVVLALMAGLVGGVVASRLFTNQPVFAKDVTSKSTEIPPEHQVIIAREIMLLDLNRKPRIRLMVDQNGEPGLHFYDEEGIYRAGFSVGAGTPALTMHDKSGLRLQIGLLSLTSMDVEWPTILMMDEKGVEKIILTLDPIGRPHLTLKDDKDNPRAVLGYTSLKHTQTVIGGKRPPSSLVLFNERGEVIWKAP
jgi:hypothetical protein